MNSTTIDPDLIEKLVNRAVYDNVLLAIENLAQDPVWLSKIENMINQTIVQQTITRIGSIDIGSIIRQRVDENMQTRRTGISDQATTTQLTVMDDNTVVENCLTSRDLTVPGYAIITNLVLKGSVNTDNAAWNGLSAEIAQRTLDKISVEWRQQLIEQTAEHIKLNGIDFDKVTIGGQPLINGAQLASSITESNIQSVGVLKTLEVSGEAHINDTINVVRGRVGVNTTTPEMALSVWDEEISLTIGKFNSKQAYMGTNREQGLVLGINRIPQLEIDSSGMTTVKKLKIGIHQISHDVQVPGWSGTRGDLVLNSNPGNDRVFGWLCLGAFKWQPLKSAE